MDKRREAEYDRLDADHPEWWMEEGSFSEVHTRYWMYFSDDVAMARAIVYWRRLIAPVATLVDWLNRKLTGTR